MGLHGVHRSLTPHCPLRSHSSGTWRQSSTWDKSMVLAPPPAWDRLIDWWWPIKFKTFSKIRTCVRSPFIYSSVPMKHAFRNLKQNNHVQPRSRVSTGARQDRNLQGSRHGGYFLRYLTISVGNIYSTHEKKSPCSSVFKSRSPLSAAWRLELQHLCRWTRGLASSVLQVL